MAGWGQIRNFYILIPEWIHLYYCHVRQCSNKKLEGQLIAMSNFSNMTENLVLLLLSVFAVESLESFDITGIKPFLGATPNMTRVQFYSDAFIHCPVHNLGNSSVAWIRMRDIRILTVNNLAYINDRRFQTKYNKEDEDWVLQIKNVQARDSGIYECQVNGMTGKISRQVELKVEMPKALILGDEEYYIKEGSNISVVCTIENPLRLKQRLFWYHNENMINFNNITNEISVETMVDKKISSKLYIKNVYVDHAGNYTCRSENSVPTSIQLHVLKGDRAGTLISSQPIHSDASQWTLAIALFVTSFLFGSL